MNDNEQESGTTFKCNWKWRVTSSRFNFTRHRGILQGTNKSLYFDFSWIGYITMEYSRMMSRFFGFKIRILRSKEREFFFIKIFSFLYSCLISLSMYVCTSFFHYIISMEKYYIDTANILNIFYFITERRRQNIKCCVREISELFFAPMNRVKR